MAIIDGMKKLAPVFILLLAAVVAVGIWYSPLAGRATVYRDNAPLSRADGLVYSERDCVRTQTAGGVADIPDALKSLCASEVARAEAGGRVIVYAYSPRVAVTLELSDGTGYNVMAACDGQVIVIGTPLIEGSY